MSSWRRLGAGRADEGGRLLSESWVGAKRSERHEGRSPLEGSAEGGAAASRAPRSFRDESHRRSRCLTACIASGLGCAWIETKGEGSHRLIVQASKEEVRKGGLEHGRSSRTTAEMGQQSGRGGRGVIEKASTMAECSSTIMTAEKGSTSIRAQRCQTGDVGSSSSAWRSSSRRAQLVSPSASPKDDRIARTV